MLKKTLLTGLAAAVLTTGAIALQPTPAEAGRFSLHIGIGNSGYHGGGHYGYRRCFTDYRPVRVKRGYGWRTIWKPVRRCY